MAVDAGRDQAARLGGLVQDVPAKLGPVDRERDGLAHAHVSEGRIGARIQPEVEERGPGLPADLVAQRAIGQHVLQELALNGVEMRFALTEEVELRVAVFDHRIDDLLQLGPPSVVVQVGGEHELLFRRKALDLERAGAHRLARGAKLAGRSLLGHHIG
jgi:hypothetical protein